MMDYFLIGTGLLVVINFAVTIYLVTSNSLDRFQKVAQVIIVWLIPYIGAVGLWLFNRSQDVDNVKPSGRSFGGGAHDSIGGSGGD